MNEILTIAPAGLLTSLGCMLFAWAISVPLRDVSVVDSFWSVAVAGTGLAYWLASGAATPRGALAIGLAIVWAVRLAAFVTWRNHGKPEDRRYQEIRARNEPGFAGKSLYLIFGFQALLAFVVGLPLLGAQLGAAPLAWLDALGVGVFVFGLVFESVADQQMAAFQREPRSERGVMDRGLWRYSRHPNYFGEFCLWWGLYLIALAGGAWWSFVGPLLLTFFLLKVSGVALTEKDIAGRRPDYADYIRRTSAFVPWIPRRDAAKS